MAFRRRNIVLRCAALAALASCAVSPPLAAQQVDAKPADAKPAKASKAKAAPAAPAAPKSEKLDVAGAQAMIDSAGKLLAAGKSEPAVAQLSTVISAGNLPAAVMAKALYLRGAAYRQQSKPAQAIADLTSALWLKGGLNDTDRADATQQRAAAYGEAGLSEQGQAIASSSKAKHGSAAAEAPTPPAQSSGGLFAGLFGGNSTSTPKDETPKAPPPAAKAPVSSQASNWAVATKPATAAPATAPPTIALAHTPSAPAAHAAAATPTGHVVNRVALVRTQSQAEAVVAKLKQQYATVLGSHSTNIGQATFGNMGSFFEVAVGPFTTTAEAQAVCAKLKGSGLDCVPLTR